MNFEIVHREALKFSNTASDTYLNSRKKNRMYTLCVYFNIFKNSFHLLYFEKLQIFSIDLQRQKKDGDMFKRSTESYFIMNLILNRRKFCDFRHQKALRRSALFIERSLC